LSAQAGWLGIDGQRTMSGRQGAPPMWEAAMRSKPSAARYAPGLEPQGASAELMDHRWEPTRDDLDAYSARSHQRAAPANSERGIVPVVAADGSVVDSDESIRPATTAETLAADAVRHRRDAGPLPAPRPEGRRGQHVRAGRRRQCRGDYERGAHHGLRPRACIHAMAVVGDDVVMKLTGPIRPRGRCRRAGLRIDDVDHDGVNGAFASVPLAWRAHVDADPARLNPRGGVIALGHPLGASGA
jgi:acetyl-CoA acyltransferase